jgi:hypothetical protein
MAAFSRYWKIGLLWALSLIAVGYVSASAQPFLLTETPRIVAGSDLGFRVERTQNGIAVGRVVVRVDGRWIDTVSSVPPAAAR